MSIAVLLIDGDCEFCLRWAAWARAVVRPDAKLVPYQQVDLDAVGVTVDDCRSAVQWIADGRRTASGGAAVAELLASGRQPWASFGHMMRTPPLRAIVDTTYRAVARHRAHLPAPRAVAVAS